MMHPRYTRQFEFKALKQTFNLLSEHQRLHLVHHHYNYETQCELDLVLPKRERHYLSWHDVTFKNICRICLKNAWILLFDFIEQDEDHAMLKFHHWVTLDNQLRLMCHWLPEKQATCAHLLCVAYPKLTLEKWLPLMLDAKDIDTLFGKRWTLKPEGCFPQVMRLQTTPTAPYTYSEATHVLRERKGDDHVCL